jgi:hypothetical protein
MSGRNRNIAYVRYDNTGRIVPGGPIITSVKPKVGDWVAVDDVLTTTPNYKLRGFIRYIKNGDYVAGSLILQHDAPQDGNWKEVYVLYPSPVVPTTTTTTTNIPVTTTTTSSSTSTSTSTTSTTTTLTSNQYFELYRCSDNASFYSKDYPNGTFSDLGSPRVTGYVDFELTTFIINSTVNNSTNPTGVEITSTGFFGCPTTSTTTTAGPITTTTTTTAGPATTTTTTTFGPINYDLSVLCPVVPNQSMNVLATNFTGGVGTVRFWSRFTYLTKAEADNPSIEYFGPFDNPGGLQWGTDYIPPTVVEVWVSVKDANGNQTSKGIVLNCPTITTTTTQYTPFTTTTSTTPNPSDPYKSYRVNMYICDQDCTPTLYNQTITVAQAGSVQIGKYYLSATNPNISYFILEQVGWNGNPGNDITTFTAYNFCYEACGYTPTTTTTTTILSAPVNTVFVNYDVVPGSGQDVNTVFVKYDIQ